jgi:hypothetical protein
MPLRVRPKTSARVAKLSQHEADGGEFQEREGVAVEILTRTFRTSSRVLTSLIRNQALRSLSGKPGSGSLRPTNAAGSGARAMYAWRS